MSSVPIENQAKQEGEASFAELLDQSQKSARHVKPGQLVRGTVVAKNGDQFLIDVGTKMDGFADISEFEFANVKAGSGDQFDFLVKHISADGVVLSFSEARQQIEWSSIESAYASHEMVIGLIKSETKGGFQIDLNGVRAFLPWSEAERSKRVRADQLLGVEAEFEIIRFDAQKKNIVVSRKQSLEAIEQESQAKFFTSHQVNDVIQATVSHMSSFGAFVDVGGFEALLHLNDIDWRHLQHPSDVLSVGQVVKVQITQADQDKGKVGVSMKALSPDPWTTVPDVYTLGMRITGTVRKVLDHGAIIELSPGVEGMVHRSELHWRNQQVRPLDVMSEGDIVDVLVLNVDAEKRRIGLSLKQVTESPWQLWLSQHSPGTKVKGKIVNKTEFGIFVKLDDDLDGMVHISNFSWTERSDVGLDQYNKGDQVEALVLGVDVERQRISLGIKQLEEDPFKVFLKGIRIGSVVSGEVESCERSHAKVRLSESVLAELPMKEVPKEMELSPGQKVECKIIRIEDKTRRVLLSVKKFQWDEEKDALASYQKKSKKDGAPSALALELMAKFGKKE